MPDPSPSLPDLDSLATIARALEGAAHEVGWGSAPVLVGIDASSGAAGRALPEVPTTADDPVAALLGYEVPAECFAVAVVAEGRGRRLPPARGEGGDDATPRPVGSERHRLAYVLDREGRVGSVVRRRGADPVVDVHADGREAGPAGRLVDVCHRTLGLGTAPPPADTSRLWLLGWLDSLLACSLERRTALTWDQAVGLHPAVAVLDEIDHVPAGLPPAVLAGIGRSLGRLQTWPEIRAAAVAGEGAPGGVSPEHAAWMDDGMFARWVTADFLPVPLYVAELADALPAAVAAKVRAVVDATPGAGRRG